MEGNNMLTLTFNVPDPVFAIFADSPAIVNDIDNPRILVERDKVIIAILDTRYNVGVVTTHSAHECRECQDK